MTTAASPSGASSLRRGGGASGSRGARRAVVRRVSRGAGWPAIALAPLVAEPTRERPPCAPFICRRSKGRLLVSPHMYELVDDGLVGHLAGSRIRGLRAALLRSDGVDDRPRRDRLGHLGADGGLGLGLLRANRAETGSAPATRFSGTLSAVSLAWSANRSSALAPRRRVSRLAADHVSGSTGGGASSSAAGRRQS